MKKPTSRQRSMLARLIKRPNTKIREQKNMFTKFYRAENAQKARPDGTGLGLFMAQKVIVAQGGAIIFHSEPGKGSTFGFSFAKSKLEELAKAKQTKPAQENPSTNTLS